MCNIHQKCNSDCLCWHWQITAHCKFVGFPTNLITIQIRLEFVQIFNSFKCQLLGTCNYKWLTNKMLNIDFFPKNSQNFNQNIIYELKRKIRHFKQWIGHFHLLQKSKIFLKNIFATIGKLHTFLGAIVMKCAIKTALLVPERME